MYHVTAKNRRNVFGCFYLSITPTTIHKPRILTLVPGTTPTNGVQKRCLSVSVLDNKINSSLYSTNQLLGNRSMFLKEQKIILKFSAMFLFFQNPS